MHGEEDADDRSLPFESDTHLCIHIQPVWPGLGDGLPSTVLLRVVISALHFGPIGRILKSLALHKRVKLNDGASVGSFDGINDGVDVGSKEGINDGK